jgi:hypothetical protein
VYSNTATRSGPNVLVDDNAGQLTVSYLVDLTGVEGSVTVLPAPPPPPPPPSPPLPPPPPMICLDTCGTAGDTVCQDGDWGAFGSMCEFGTDCSDCGSRLLLDPPASPPVFPPPPSPPPLSPGVGADATGDPGATQDADPGLAIGLALGGCLLVAVLAAAVFFWHHKRRMQPPPSNAPTAAPQQVEVTMTYPHREDKTAFADHTYV